VPQEARVAVVLNGTRVAQLAASPLDLEALAVGHLLLNGHVARPEHVRQVQVRRWRAEWHVAVHARVERGAGARPRSRPPRLAPAQVRALVKALLDGAALYREGGGVHTSALATRDGLVHLAADVGKVNTLDRLAGQAARAGTPTAGLVLLTTGRLTGAMAERGLALGCRVLVSHSGPTTAALEAARRARATLVGYARGGGFLVYTHPERIARRSR
jgi:FdhD protein